MAISPTFVSKGSKPRILKNANLVILWISELTFGYHENSISSKSETPKLIFQFISSLHPPRLISKRNHEFVVLTKFFK
jgi:hypothetical protein